MIFLTLFLTGFAYVLFNPTTYSVLNYISHLFYKFVFQKKYILPERNAFDYDIPPFPNTWHPIDFSSNIKKGYKYNICFLNQEFILFRNDNNEIQIIPKYCPHMGVDLNYGCITGNCIECPMHGKKVMNMGEKEIIIKELIGIIFVWKGENNEPDICLKEIFDKFNMEEYKLLPLLSMSRWVGGHIIDFYEHLLDVEHAPFIHKVKIEPLGITYIDKSLIVKFKTADNDTYDFNPKFNYITPYFGFIEYVPGTRAYIRFYQEKIGKLKMQIIPSMQITNNWYKTIYTFTISLLFTLYTYIDFSDEAAYFSTKKHTTRKLKKCEKGMDELREKFVSNFYTKEQVEIFNKKKEYYNYDKKYLEW